MAKNTINFLDFKANKICGMAIGFLNSCLKSRPQFKSATMLSMNGGVCQAAVMSKDKIIACRVLFCFKCSICGVQVKDEMAPKSSLIPREYLMNKCKEH